MTLLEYTKTNPPKTDKYDLGYFHAFYSDLFSPLKDQSLNILEIGTYYGDSVKYWRDYFPNSVVFALDVFHCPNIVNEERLVHIVGDAYNTTFLNTLPNKFFDIIIDDGPHTYESMEFFLLNYIKLLKPNGLMILEDIIDVTWTPRLLQLIDRTKFTTEVIHTAGRQRTPELLQKWSNGLDIIVIRKK